MSVQAYSEVETITITCSNYNNPVFRRETTGFQLQISDNERLANTIFKSNTWGFDKSAEDDLIAREVPADAFDFKFYLNRNATAETAAIGIQK
jgi:hypothetical protein